MKWVTREYVHLDRVASPWLVRRFVDLDAEFVFVPWTQEHRRPADAIPLALPGAELGPHDATGTTFDKIVAKYALDDPAIARIARIIRAGVAYVLEGYRPPADDIDGQTAVGLLAFAEGMLLTHLEDNAILEASFVIYDALYANFRTHALVAARGLAVPTHGDPRGPSQQIEFLRAIHAESAPATASDARSATRNLLGGLALCAAMLASASAPAQVTQGVVLNGVTIVDTHDGKLTPNRAIVIDGGKITEITRANSVKVSGSAKLVDARGKFVVPGYLDMHAHPLMSSDPEGGLTLMLANGVTGFRQMSGTPELLAQRKEGKGLPSAEAPELLVMPGTILIGLNAGSPEAAIAEVDRQKEMGADFIKVIDVGPPAFFAALGEATKLGLPFLGHLPPTVDVVKASQAGMRSIEHLGPKESVLLGCSTDEAALRQAIAQAPPRAPQIVPGPVAAAMAARAVANPIMATDPVEFTLMRRVVDTYSDAKCRKLAALFVANQTWQTPTLIRLRTMEFGDDPRYRNDPNLQFVPRPTRALWDEMAQQFPAKISPDTKKMLTRFFALQLKLVKLFQEIKVPMLAGSDAGGSQWDIPGFSLHQEFDLLKQAGLTPLEILQMTTLNGARFLGREASMGSVAVGKDANLVVLDGNPVASVANLHRVRAVVRAGTFYSRAALDDMKERTKNRQIADASGPIGQK